jgi:2-iminobutanoate/2-iminopropanoate deaminase
MSQQTINLPGLEHSGGVPAACRVGPIVATSVIMGRDPRTREMPAGAEEQARNAFDNLGAVLAAAGLSVDDVVKLTIYVSEDHDREATAKYWNACWPDPERRPARRTLLIPMRNGWRVQLEALAVAKDAQGS